MASPSGERVSLAQLCDVRVADGASVISREGNSRYVALKFSVVGRDLGSTVEEAIAKVGKQVKLPVGYHVGLGRRIRKSQQALLAAPDAIIVPITLLVICLILYYMFGSIKWVLLILANVAMAPIGGLAGAVVQRTPISACRPASDSSRCSAFPCRWA